ncbi:MAG: AGE family epimerase/isomerase, partial [Pseudomonadota bacterium]
LNPDGTVLDGRLDLYDHAFVLLASAERYRAYRDARALDAARFVLSVLDGLRMEMGGYAEGNPPISLRRQNPHMHLFEAFMVMQQADMPLDQDDRLEEMRQLFKDVLYDDEAHIVREFFDENWNLHPEKGQEAEPGHMVEWAWLAAQGGIDSVSHDLINRARSVGYHDETALMANVVQLVTGHDSGACRLWPQTEHIRAITMLARWGDASFDQAALLLQRTMDRYFPEALGGGYHDEFAVDGTQLSQHMPSSSLYHLITMADEIVLARQDLSAS